MSLIQLLKLKKLETRLFKMPRLETPHFQWEQLPLAMSPPPSPPLEQYIPMYYIKIFTQITWGDFTYSKS